MSLSPLRPASDEVKVKAFFSLEASLGAVEAARAPLIAVPPTDTADAEATGLVAELDVAAVDVDATVIKGAEPAVVEADATDPTGGRVMVKDKGAAESVATEGSVLMAETAVIAVDAPAADDVAVTLGAC